MILISVGIAFVVIMFYFTRLLLRILSPVRFRQIMRLLIPAYLLINWIFTLFIRSPGEYPVLFVVLRSFLAVLGWDVKSFTDLGRLLSGSWEEPVESSFVPMLGLGQNIILFIPFGFLLCAANRHPRTGRILLLGFLLSLLNEAGQLFFRLGWFEVDDILYNVLGTYVGVLLYRRIEK
jgi:glycopeptide antibiotics resistance protein